MFKYSMERVKPVLKGYRTSNIKKTTTTIKEAIGLLRKEPQEPGSKTETKHGKD